MTTWRPIATAPRNSGDLYICYSPGKRYASNENAQDPHFRIDGFSDRWPNGRYQYPEAPYTHWMPLPPPPAKEKRK